MSEKDKTRYYIGKKGYSIQKNTLSQSEMYELRNELTVKPNSGMPGYSCSASYPVYRESTNKIYIPRHFGIEKFGSVSKINISQLVLATTDASSGFRRHKFLEPK